MARWSSGWSTSPRTGPGAATIVHDLVAATRGPAAATDPGPRRATGPTLPDSEAVDDRRLRELFVSSSVASLATVRPDGGPHVVPVVFALVQETIFIAVDHKPKRSMDLQRLVNARHEPRCSVLVDHYEDDWSALWWVRADGRAEVLDDPGADHPALHALARRYHQHAATPPTGAVLAITVERWSGWSSSA